TVYKLLYFPFSLSILLHTNEIRISILKLITSPRFYIINNLFRILTINRVVATNFVFILQFVKVLELVGILIFVILITLLLNHILCMKLATIVFHNLGYVCFVFKFILPLRRKH